MTDLLKINDLSGKLIFEPRPSITLKHFTFCDSNVSTCILRGSLLGIYQLFYLILHVSSHHVTSEQCYLRPERGFRKSESSDVAYSES